MTQIYNFSAGPSTLPKSVLERAQKEFVNYKTSGVPLIEMSHRSELFEEIVERVEKKLRQLIGINDDYHILFLHGGASSQFAMVPMNLMYTHKADYIVTGHWANKANEVARSYGDVSLIWNGELDNYRRLPILDEIRFSKEADYIHFCSNNTIYGTQFNYVPSYGDRPVICDHSSDILSRPMDIEAFDLIYASSQKNIGPAGVTLVIIKKELLKQPAYDKTPEIMSYKVHAGSKKLYNTPTSYTIYIMDLVLDWLIDLGGLEEIEKINREKAKLLYDFIDQSQFYNGFADVKDRSLMNVVFTTGNAKLDLAFAREAEKDGLMALKGHKKLGMLRASIYNAMPIDGVKSLIRFMESFEKRYSD